MPVANNLSVTFSEAVQGVSATTFQLRNSAGATVAATVTRNGTTNQWILNPTANLTGNAPYRVNLTGGPTAIRDLAGAPLASSTWTFTTQVAPPPAPVIATATSGLAGGTVNARANWNAPAVVAGAPVTNYRVRAERMFVGQPTGQFVTSSLLLPSTARTLLMNLPAGQYRFTVEAINAGGSTRSGNSNTVTAQ